MKIKQYRYWYRGVEHSEITTRPGPLRSPQIPTIPK
jgi:hypothetical protein